MPRDPFVRVLLAPSTEAPGELRQTALFRGDVVRSLATDPSAALDAARAEQPDLIVVDGDERATALGLLQALKSDGATRHIPVAIWPHEAWERDMSDFGRAGASLVLPRSGDPALWDRRLGELLGLSLRQALRVPVRLTIWCRGEGERQALGGIALNLSARGMLVESPEPLPVGSRWEMRFRLPGDSQDLSAVGQVVRQVPGIGSARAGMEFIRVEGDGRPRIAELVAGTRRDA